MTPNKIREAAQFLMKARSAHKREADLPEALRPKTEAEAGAIWSAILAANEQPIVGWKIATNSPTGRARTAPTPKSCSPIPARKRAAARGRQ